MFTRNYYCLIAGLPDLFLDGKIPGALSPGFKEELKEQLHPSDYELVELVYLHFDNKNLLNLLCKQEKPFIPLGNYSKEYLEEQINEPTTIVDYLANFILTYKAKADGFLPLTGENQLQALYYGHVSAAKNVFLKNWLKFDKDLKNLLIAVNCRKYNYSLKEQLIAGQNGNELYDLLLKSAPKADILANELPYATEILSVYESETSITNKEKAIDYIRWKYLDEHSFFNYFSVEQVISYIVKLEMAERWAKLDDETGKVFFNKMIETIKSSYEFAEEFNLAKSKKISKI